MAKLAFNTPRVYSKADVLKLTAFSKSEEPILEQVLVTFRAANNCQAGIILALVGGAATRFYTCPELTGRLACRSTAPDKTLVHATDVDVVIPAIPTVLRERLNERKLIKLQKLEVTSRGPQQTLIESHLSVFSFPQGGHFEGLEDVDVFHDDVGGIRTNPADLSRIQTVLIGDPADPIRVQIADPGFLIATIANPDCATDTRIKRTAFILVSCDSTEECREIGIRYGKIIKRSKLRFFDTDYGRVFQSIKRFAGKMHEKAEAFIDAAKQELGFN